MKQLPIYDLPVILFESYLKEYCVTEIKECKYVLSEKEEPLPCKYAALPDGITVVLIDTRHAQFPSHREAILMVKIRPISPNNEGKIDELFGVGEVKASWASCTMPDLSSVESFSPSQHWFTIQFSLGKSNPILSFDSIRASANLHFLEIVKRAQKLCIDPNYQWITSWIFDNEAIEINGKQVTEVSAV